MRSRFAAIVVLAAAVALGTSGCGLLAPQATTIHYDASDGVGGSVGDIDVRNALIIANEDGSAGNLVVTVVNNGSSAHSVTIEFANGSSTEVVVDADEIFTFSAPAADDAEREDIVIDPLDAKIGSTTTVFFQYGSETGVSLDVPVYNGDLPEYSTLVPTPAEAK
ncbi:hypothetical protein [Paramicrobacterium chengjingii]|uniref:DNA modification methylase n=1 Tax=Paramicrobacterium chengjingii TaxID=2769067 RepID=A0ABX6YF32_9MICO|nr:hypothetical protein [Microbacterium chengjingii]QPZ37377.1 hypothetical protein HCR76_11045 [Microbacterium chengjingii]